MCALSYAREILLTKVQLLCYVFSLGRYSFIDQLLILAMIALKKESIMYRIGIEGSEYSHWI